MTDFFSQEKNIWVSSRLYSISRPSLYLYPIRFWCQYLNLRIALCTLCLEWPELTNSVVNSPMRTLQAACIRQFSCMPSVIFLQCFWSHSRHFLISNHFHLICYPKNVFTVSQYKPQRPPLVFNLYWKVVLLAAWLYTNTYSEQRTMLVLSASNFNSKASPYLDLCQTQNCVL